jgi:hypothetical protein
VQRNTIASYFARLFGRTTPYSAGATAIAVGPTVTNAVHNGLFPAGFAYNPNGAALQYGTVYTITDGYSPGNWGWLDLPAGSTAGSTASSAPQGGGAAQLSTNITSGCTCDASVGSWVSTETGVNWGPVSSAVNSLVDGSTVPSTLTGNEPQLVTVPIVDWSTSTGGSGGVQIKGFAQVWLIGISKNGSAMNLKLQFVQYVTKYASGGGAGSGSNFGSSKMPYLVQ